MAHAEFDDVWTAISEGNCQKIDALVRAGMPVDTKSDASKWNFLHAALVSVRLPPKPALIRHLISLGVDVNAKDSIQWTPLHYAARTKNVPILKLLIDAGADVNAVNDAGLSPLHQSLTHGAWSVEVAELLLAAGADPDNTRGSGTLRKYVNGVACPESQAMRKLFEKYPNPSADVPRNDRPIETVRDAVARAAQPRLKYFYFDARSRREVPSAEAMEAPADAILETWKSLSRQPGSFFGVYCPGDVVVQLRWADPHSLTIDIPRPAMSGSITRQATFEECTDALVHVCYGGEPESIEGLRFESW